MRLSRPAAWFAACCTILAPASAQAPSATLYVPGIVSTADTEVRVTASPDGKVLLWGHIGADGRLTILMRLRNGTGWAAPQPAPFIAAGNDFDPLFAPDGKSVLFFSNRPGGLGKDDIWQAPYAAGAFGEPRNLGPAINSAGSEWAPGLSADGKHLLFSTDGRGGAGRHDLFVADRSELGWRSAKALPGALNTAEDEFDATFLGNAIVFARGNADDGPVRLHIAGKARSGYAAGRLLPAPVNCSDFVIGPSLLPEDPSGLYFSARCPGGAGRMDIWRIDRAALR